MYDIDYTRQLLNRTLELVQIMNELYEVEDGYLETWLAEGVPDGSTLQEIIEMMEVDPYLFQEWVDLATDLLTARYNKDK